MRAMALVLGFLWIAGCDGGGGGAGGGTDAPPVAGDADLAGGSQDAVAEDVPPEGPPVVPGADYLILAAGNLLGTAEAFRAYREGTGHTVALATLDQLLEGAAATDYAASLRIKDWVALHWEARDPDRPLFLLLVGDAEDSFNDPDETLPAADWAGGWQGCLSDNAYGDMDGDHVPEVAVGRLPVRDDATGLDLLDRIRGHEEGYVPGPWNHRLNVYAGEGGFGEDVDFFIETVAQKGLEAVPMPFDIRFAYKSPGSTWYYAPFEDIVHEMVTSGAVLTTFMGHGGGELDVPDLAQVKPADRFPMYAFFACSTGEFAGDAASDAERVMLQPGGPMALLVSTATTHPYANAINALELEAAVFEDRPATYGEAIVGMKWRSLYHESDLRDLVDGFAETQMSRDEMEDTVRDHMYSYNLLGDPAVRLLVPQGDVLLEAAGAAPGGEVAFTGEIPRLAGGSAHVRLVCGRASLIHTLTPVEDPTDPASWPTVQANWEAAMDHTVDASEVAIDGDGAFSGTLQVPAGTPKGTYWAVVYAEEEGSDGLGSAEVAIK
ncbi:MAG: hypothetical protein FJ098_03275 [Deltaproteobacteria bacterium]|nr:hypothetical protein [Deltaproteobacteria bacterium]